MTKTVPEYPVPRTGSCSHGTVTVRRALHSRVHVQIHVDSVFVRSLGDGRLDYVGFEIRLHYKLDVLYIIATFTSCASSYYQRSYHAER